MIPLAARWTLRSPFHRLAVAVAIGLAFAPMPARATNFNVDYEHHCAADFGGIAFAIQGMFTPTGDYIGAPFNQYDFEFKSCTTSNFTLVSWACDAHNTLNSGPCIQHDQLVHVGFSSGLSSHVVNSAFVYRNTSEACEYTPNLNLDINCLATGYDDECAAVPARPRLLADPLQFHPLAVTTWAVHADGKSLTVINGQTFPSRPCPGPVYVGNMRFGYYATQQPLATLNRDSLRAPISSIDPDGNLRIPCDDTLTASVFSNPPDGAQYVVVSATQDTVPELDSPGASHVWIQEAIVREGQHAIGTNAGPNGAISPFGPVVVANGASRTFTITPDAGHRVADVLVDGASVGAVTTYTFSNVTADHRIDATFAVINSPPNCDQVTAVPAQIWPPDHRLVTVKLAGLTDPDHDPITAKIVRVTQDEPLGPGNHRPDAVVGFTDTCQLRAERAGNGNGRVYTLWYTASDGRGGECEGSVKVCVPHDRHDVECIDDGPEGDESRPRSPGAADAGWPNGGRLELGKTLISGTQATVEYSIPSAGTVQLSLFDVAGRRMVAIENSPRSEGVHQASWNTDGLSSGIYFYRLRTGSDVVVKAVMIR